MSRVRLRLRLRARTRVKVEVECGGWKVRGPLVAGARVGLIGCGVVWYHGLTERGECGAGDGVVLVVALKRRTTQGEGA